MLVAREKPRFQALSKGLIVLLCAEVVRQGVPDHGALHGECSAANSGKPMSWNHHHMLMCHVIVRNSAVWHPIQSNVIWRAQVDPLCPHFKRQYITYITCDTKLLVVHLCLSSGSAAGKFIWLRHRDCFSFLSDTYKFTYLFTYLHHNY